MLGDEIRKSRVQAKLTQEELALRAKVSRNYVSLIELNQKSPTVAVLLRVCKAMKTKASLLFAQIGE